MSRPSGFPMPQNSSHRSSLKILNYATPTVTAAVYLVASLVLWKTSLAQRDHKLSRFKKVALVGTSFAIATSYAAETLQLLRYLSDVPDDVLVHAIAQTQLWTTLSLISLNTTKYSPWIWLLVPLLNLALESGICTLTYSITHAAGQTELNAFEAIQIVSCVFLVFHATLTWQLTQIDTYSSEAQSLLSKASKTSYTASGVAASYHTVETDESIDPSGRTSPSAYDSGDEEDEEDDNEAKALMRSRLESSGSWWNYIKEFKIFLPYLIPARNPRIQFYIGFLIANTIAIRALNVLEPRQLGILIDAMTTRHEVPWRHLFIWILLKIASSNSCGIGAASEMLENRLQAWSSQELSVASFDHVMSLSMGFHDEKDSGEVIKAIEQADSLNSLSRSLIIDIIPAGLDIFIAIFYVTHLFDIYALLIMITIAIMFIFCTYYITGVMTGARRLSTKKSREESRLVYESVSNWFTVSYFNRKNFIMGRLLRAAQAKAITQVWSDDIYTYLYLAQDSAEVLGLLAITILAARRVFNGTSTVGDFVNMETYWYTITLPLYILSRSYRNLNSKLVDAERLLQLFKQTPTIQDHPSAQALELTKGEVVFNDVQFAYPSRQTTLNNIDFVASPGQLIALVGETGSGKSTIFKLLMRFHDVTNGGIKIDGQDLRAVTLDSLRESFGFVPQDTVLFNLSILENVRYGRLDASDEEVYAACRAACIHDKILAFPKGYASKVGERGVKLSGGERQRIAIARVFLKGAPIVLLDEATSAMDSQTESKIQEALKNLIRGKTTFVIAHRLSTVVEADKILVIDNGHIVESGTHQELLLQRGRYLELWKKQAALQ